MRADPTALASPFPTMPPRVTTSTFCCLFLLATAGPISTVRATPASSDSRTLAGQNKNQTISDQGDGTFLNPILSGHQHDPTGVRVGLKVRHRDHDMTFYPSADGENWTLILWGASPPTETTQRIGLYASGNGTVQFRKFTYRGLP